MDMPMQTRVKWMKSKKKMMKILTLQKKKAVKIKLVNILIQKQTKAKMK